MSNVLPNFLQNCFPFFTKFSVTMAQTRNKICFSYSTRDIVRAQQAKTGLENLGYEVFWGLDISSMSRQDWRKQWCEQCIRADYCINFLSAPYVQSSSCASEWNYAEKHAKTVLNITLNGRHGRTAISNLMMNEVADTGGQAIRMFLDSGGQSNSVYPTDDIATKIHTTIARGNNRSNGIQGNTTATSNTRSNGIEGNTIATSNNRSNGIQGISLSSGTTTASGSLRHTPVYFVDSYCVGGGNCLCSNCVRSGNMRSGNMRSSIAMSVQSKTTVQSKTAVQSKTESPNVGVHPAYAKNKVDPLHVYQIGDSILAVYKYGIHEKVTEYDGKKPSVGIITGVNSDGTYTIEFYGTNFLWQIYGKLMNKQQRRYSHEELCPNRQRSFMEDTQNYKKPWKH